MKTDTVISISSNPLSFEEMKARYKQQRKERSSFLSKANTEIIKSELENSTASILRDPLNSLVLHARDWRYAPDPVKMILYVAALEAENGPSWAVTAQFSISVERKLCRSKKSPATFLKDRFRDEFGFTVPRAGVFELAGRNDNNRLHVHMLLPKELFSDKADVRKRLRKVFGNAGHGTQIDVRDTQIEKPFDGTKHYGFKIGGGAGFLLYGTKNSNLTRNELELTRRKRPPANQKHMDGRLSNKRLDKALSMSGLDLQPHKFYFDDMVFRTDEVTKLATQMWEECRAEFVDAAYEEMKGDTAPANDNGVVEQLQQTVLDEPPVNPFLKQVLANSKAANGGFGPRTYAEAKGNYD